MSGSVTFVSRINTRALALMLAALLALAATLAPVVAGSSSPSTAHARDGDAACGTADGEQGKRQAYITHEELGKQLEVLESNSKGRVDVEVAGYSNRGRELYKVRIGGGDAVLLVTADVHGNEHSGSKATLRVLRWLAGDSRQAQEMRENVTLVALPMYNPDGSELDQRRTDMSWDEVVERHPQLAGAPSAWYHSSFWNGFDLNRDFNPDLAYEPDPDDLPGTSTDPGFFLTPEADTLRGIYLDLQDEFGEVEGYVDLHHMGPCQQTVGSTPNVFTIDEPSSAEGDYKATGASFGPNAPRGGVKGEVVVADDGTAEPTEACEPLVDFPEGAIALVDRGGCTFVQKVSNAQDAGAVAVVVVQNTAGDPINLGGSDPDVTIPSGMISRDDGDAIKAGLPATGSFAYDPGRYVTVAVDYPPLPPWEFEEGGRWEDYPNMRAASRQLSMSFAHGVEERMGKGVSDGIARYFHPDARDFPGQTRSSLALNGTATVLVEMPGQTQHIGNQKAGQMIRIVENGLRGMLDGLATGEVWELDDQAYYDYPAYWE